MTSADRPNVVIIHWHDLGTYLSAYGYRVDTPHTEALARESTLFTRCFSTSPLCSPARGSLWTGRYPHSNGLQGLTHRGWEFNDGERTLPMYLADEGYRTALAGLQHESSDPTRLGFEEVLGPDQAWAQDVGSVASAWLDAQDRQADPFLLVCGMVEAHRDWPEDRYPPTIPPDQVDVPSYLPDNEHTRRDLAAFASAIHAADQGVGLILDALARNDLDRNSIVIFTTDHGAPFPGAKSTLHDPGVHVALMVRLPPIWRGDGPRTENGLVSHVDLVPTILELLEIPVPDHVQGQSVARSLSDGTPPERQEVYLEKTYHSDYDPVRAVRTDSFKYIRSFEERSILALPPDLEDSRTRQGMGDEHLAVRPREELYDLRSDPHEIANVVDEPAHLSTANMLRQRLDEFMATTDDALLHGPIRPPERVPGRNRSR
ncbi:sulfatase family protein [Ruania halotolerans]|uniref:sulfatase family protein n=1 Tax=Ruania halotolerans TaxID=2897773 RepID=UPI001E50825D|nr:sulfatase [Ruania halotolerans]UFU06816.1 sulfatase [Ruania halotolerans]